MASKHELSIKTTVKDFASKNLRGVGKEGKKAGQSIAAGFLKAQIAMGLFKAGIRGLSRLMKGLTTELGNQGDEFAKMSKSLGISVETLSAMKHAAELSGASFQSVANGMKFLAKNAYDMSQGMGDAKDAFVDLNIEVVDQAGNMRALEDLFPEVAGKLGKMENATKRAALAQRIFGRAALELIPLMREGEAGIKAMMEEAKELGIVWTETEGKMAEAFVDAKLRLERAIDGIKKSVGVELFPAMTKFAEDAARWLAANRDTIKDQAIGIIGAVGDAILDAVSYVLRIAAQLQDTVTEIRRWAQHIITGAPSVETAIGPGGGGGIEEFRQQFKAYMAELKMANSKTRVKGATATAGAPGFFTMFGAGAENVKDTHDEMREMKKLGVDLGETFGTTATTGMATFFASITQGAVTASAAFQAMANDILNAFTKIATHELASQLFSVAVGAFSTAVTPGSGGGFKPATEPTLAQLGAGGGKAMMVTQNIYPTPGMSEADVANSVAQKLATSTGYRAEVRRYTDGGI